MKRRLSLYVDLAVQGDALPTECRIFHAGVNETMYGPLLYNMAARDSVLAEQAMRDTDSMIDLNHDSTNKQALALRADAADARGWYRLEDRAGDLFAVGMRWTPDGTERLLSRKQRYLSPDVIFDSESTQILAIDRMALVAAPATLGAQALISLSRRAHDVRCVSLSTSFTDIEEAVRSALRAYIPDDGMCDDCAWVRDVFDDCFVYEYKGCLWRVGYTFANGTASIVGTPAQVVTSYVPASVALARVVRALSRTAKSKGIKWTRS